MHQRGYVAWVHTINESRAEIDQKIISNIDMKKRFSFLR